MFSLVPREEIKHFNLTPDYQLAFSVINCLDPKRLKIYEGDIIVAVPTNQIPFNSPKLRIYRPHLERHGPNLVTDETVLNYSFVHPTSKKRELTDLCDAACIWFTDPSGRKVLGRDEEIPFHLIVPGTHGFRLVRSEFFNQGLSSRVLAYQTYFRTVDFEGTDSIDPDTRRSA